MTKTSDDERTATETLGAYAIGGVGFASARALGGLLGEGRSSLSDLGPEPIGSDPWLLKEVRAAITRDVGEEGARVVVDVHEAIVTLSGRAKAERIPSVEAATKTVQGIKSIRVEIATV